MAKAVVEVEVQKGDMVLSQDVEVIIYQAIVVTLNRLKATLTATVDTQALTVKVLRHQEDQAAAAKEHQEGLEANQNRTKDLIHQLRLQCLV